MSTIYNNSSAVGTIIIIIIISAQGMFSFKGHTVVIKGLIQLLLKSVFILIMSVIAVITIVFMIIINNFYF